MGKITGYATVGMVLALAKKMAIQYGALGIADVRTTPDGSDLIFIMSDGSQHRVELNFSANGVDYDDSVTKFNVNNVQAAIEALFSELQAKQNTLTAGNGISIENDTISVTDAGGLTVLPYGTLDADTTAKVFANPQNYCIGNDTSITGYVICYYGRKFDTNTLYYSSAYDLVEHTRIRYWTARIDKKSDGTATMTWGFGTKLEIDNATIYSNRASYPLLQCKGVLDFVDNTIKTGTEIRKAITIRKWH